MKHIKPYKNRKSKIKVGDYVICESSSHNQIELKNFIDNSIGKIIKCPFDTSFLYRIKYENIPPKLVGFFDAVGDRGFSVSQIVAHSKDKGELEDILAANKYNL